MSMVDNISFVILFYTAKIEFCLHQKGWIWVIYYCASKRSWFQFYFLGSDGIKQCFVTKSQLSVLDNSHIPDTLSQAFSVTMESCETIKVVRKRENYGPPTAICVKIFHLNALKNGIEISVIRSKIASEMTSERVT